MSGDLNQFIIDAVKAGQGIPPGLQPIIEKLITMGLISEEAARALMGLGEAGPTLDQVKEAADRYGLKLDELGPKVKQLQINETAAQLVKDWDVFSRVNADMGAVIAKMGPQIQKIATDALKMGASIPEGMRPLLQAMIDNGTLLDENGDKMTDLSRFNFTKPLEKMVDDLIKKLDELIQKFLDVGNTRVPPVQIPVQVQPVPGGGGDDGSHPQPMAAGGDFLVTRPTLFLAGEGGPERATFTPMNSTSHGGNTIIIEIDGRVVAESVVPEMPGAIQRLGLAR